MIGRVCFSLFAFAVFSAFADPIYFFMESASDGGYSYAWVPSFDDVISNLPDGFIAFPVDPDEYFDNAPDCYMPFSSDPAYASSTPSGPPSDGSSSGLSSYLVGFDSSVKSIALSVGGLLSACALICLIFIGWRKYKDVCFLAECAQEYADYTRTGDDRYLQGYKRID